MALGGIYETGTVTIAVGGVNVTGVGTLWSPIVEVGDWLFIGGQVGLVGAVVDDTHLTLETAWQGTLPSAAVYVIIKMSWLRYDPALTQAKVRELLEHLQAEGHFIFVEPGGEPDDATGEDGQWALDASVTPWKIWYKDAGVWVEQAPPGATIVDDQVTPPMLDADTAPKQLLFRDRLNFVSRAGDTMTGHLALPTSPAAANAARKDYVDTADALRVLKSGDIITGTLTILNANGALFTRSNAAGSPTYVSLGRTTNNEVTLGIAAVANDFLTGTSAADGVLNAPGGKLHLGAQGNSCMTFSDGGLGRLSVYQTAYRFFGNTHGISMQGPDTSTTKNFIDFADSALTVCGNIIVNMSAHTTAFSTSSDERAKPNRAKISAPEARTVIDQLEVYDFDKDGNQIRGYGVIAQQAYSVHKSLAFPPQHEDDFWTVEKAAPVPFLIAALQGANARIDKLEERLAALEVKLSGVVDPKGG